MGVPLADVDRVAIRRGARDTTDRDRAAGAADILDDDALSERRAHALGQNARGDIGRAAGRERNDQGDLLVRIVLRLRAGDAGHGNDSGNERCRDNQLFHVTPQKASRAPWGG